MEDDRVFRALADPSRRLLLDRLFERDGRTLSELEAELPMTRFGVMKHLRVLEAAGLIVTRKVGREKLHFLNPVPIQLLYDRCICKYAPERLSALADLKSALEGGKTVPSETEARPRLVYEIFIKAPAERVWDALTKPEFTTRYMSGSVFETDWRPGSAYQSKGGEWLVTEGRILGYDRPRRLVYTWHAVWDNTVAKDKETRLTWELEEQAGGMTKLTAIHDDFEGETETYKQLSGGGGSWMWVLSNLKILLETGDTLPLPGQPATAGGSQ
jgi:uncharacterized protein YndB with AHSA1/START domain/DNA-binding MarR family transcriptional regulator